MCSAATAVVYSLANGTFAPVGALPAGIAHITANHDGTLWHSSGSANALRFISEQSYGPQALPVPNGARCRRWPARPTAMPCCW